MSVVKKRDGLETGQAEAQTMPRHFTELFDLSPAEVQSLLDLALDLKHRGKGGLRAQGWLVGSLGSFSISRRCEHGSVSRRRWPNSEAQLST